jgi:hypothetical protein
VALVNGIAINEAVKKDEISIEPNRINLAFRFRIEKSTADEIAKMGIIGKRYLTRSNLFSLGRKNNGTIIHKTINIALESLFFNK